MRDVRGGEIDVDGRAGTEALAADLRSAALRGQTLVVTEKPTNNLVIYPLDANGVPGTRAVVPAPGPTPFGADFDPALFDYLITRAIAVVDANVDRRKTRAAAEAYLNFTYTEEAQELAAKPFCVVFTKLDLLGESYVPPIEAPGAFGMFAISAAARTGLDELLLAWWRQLLEMRKATTRAADDVVLP
mgnify:CR=1 FL=1